MRLILRIGSRASVGTENLIPEEVNYYSRDGDEQSAVPGGV